jgi:hypothetical protein
MVLGCNLAQLDLACFFNELGFEASWFLLPIR